MNSQHEEMLSKIRQGAIRTFGEDSAERWMNQKLRVFDDRSPFEMAYQEHDTNHVLDYFSQLTGAEDALKQAGVPEADH